MNKISWYTLGVLLGSLLVLVSSISIADNRNISIDDGLSNYHITDIIQGSKGKIWIATMDGLNCYDGYDIKSFKHDPDNPHSLYKNRIACLEEDEEGNIWIGTRRGISIYNKYVERFFNIPIEAISSIERGEDGAMFIGTISGNVFRANSREIDYTVTHPAITFSWQQRVSHFVTSIVVEGERIWVGTKNEGLFLFENNLRFSFKGNRIGSLEELGSIRSMYKDSLNRIWCCSSVGLYRFTPEEKRISVDFVASNFNELIREIDFDDHGNCYVGTMRNRIYRIREEDNRLYKEDQYWEADRFWGHMLLDESNGMWIGSAEKGLMYIPLMKNPFKTLSVGDKIFNEEWITSIFVDSSNRTWIGTKAGEINETHLYVINAQGRAYRKIDHDHRISNLIQLTSFYEDSKGDIWITSQKNVFRINRSSIEDEKYKIEVFATEERGTQYSLSLTEDINGNYWLGCWNGVFYIDGTKEPFLEDYIYFSESSLEHNGISSSETTVCYADPKDSTIWIGTKGGGLNQMKLINKGKEYEITRHLQSNDIWCVQRHLDELWIGTSNGLYLVSLDDTTVVEKRRFTDIDGLPGNKVMGIHIDNGNIWVATDKGIAFWEAKTNHFIAFNKEDGLDANYFTGAITKRMNGEILVGSIGGINCFKPSDIVTNKIVPDVIITDIKVEHQTVSPDRAVDARQLISKATAFISTLNLNYDENDIEISFAGIHYINPHKNRYSYMLEGVDHTWNYTLSNNRKAIYSNLSPGDYTFKVKASNSDDVWMQEPVSLTIHIEHPPWLSWWAYIIYGVILIVIVYLFTRFSVIKASDKYKLQMQNMIIEKERELNEAKLRFFTNISHELRTPLTLIYAPFTELIEHFKEDKKLQKKILPIQQNISRLMQLINQLLEFRKAETGNLVLKVSKGDLVANIKRIKNSFDDIAEQKHILFNFTSNESAYVSYFDFDKLEKILYNLLSNAFKYTQREGKITVETSFTKEQMILSVQDNGIGIEKRKLERIFENYYQVDDTPGGTGIGLSLVKTLTELHKGTIEVKSKKAEGTTFLLSFPLGTDKYKKYIISDIEQKFISEDELKPLLGEDEDSDVEGNAKDDQQKPIILAVEDNPEILNYLHNLLGADYQVCKAENGKEGIEKAIQLIPDLIISDILMPEMDGYELCRTLKGNIRTSHIPIILLTAKSSEESQIEGLQTGAYEYITKPFNPKILVQKVSNIIDTIQKQKEHSKKISITEPEKIQLPSMEEAFLQNLMDVLNQNLSDSRFEITNLCAEIGLSRMQLHRKLKAITGQSTAEFIRAYRFKKAAMLLESGSMNVSEVMWEVGIESNSYFSRTFKSIYGVSPSDYKKSLTEK
ncbi:hybrid sensor histidine kinase/response regulator [Puteibacter caeruleilacunae]|nr:hybrid sensor histidine kinase/response regulator [Puteibacter caeruleilacunae]